MRRLSRALNGVAVSVATLAIGALVGSAPVFAQRLVSATGSPSTNLPAPIPLRLRETTQMNWTAPNVSLSYPKCDADGHVFVRFGNYDFVRQQVQMNSAISEIIPESKRIVAHTIPELSPSDYSNSRFESFGVSLDGAVYALISAGRKASDGERAKHEIIVEQLEEGSTAGSMMTLQAPPGAAHWMADLLGVFPKGNFLVAGESSEEPGRPSAGSWRPFTAIYDSSGKFLIEITLPEDVVNEYSRHAGSTDGATRAEAPPAGGSGGNAGVPAQSTQPPKPHFIQVQIRSGGIVSGPDGNLWILRNSDPIRLYAVDAAGQVVKHFQFSPPAAGLTPSQFGFARPGQIFFDFGHIAGQSPYSGPSEIIGVFDTVSEQFNALYTVPPTKGFLGCSDGRGGFIYVASTGPNYHLTLFDFRQ